MADAPTFNTDIRPLFRQKDIDAMKRWRRFDLSKYADVKSHAEQIHRELSTKNMPCDIPWSDAQVALFKSWMDGGFVE